MWLAPHGTAWILTGTWNTCSLGPFRSLFWGLAMGSSSCTLALESNAPIGGSRYHWSMTRKLPGVQNTSELKSEDTGTREMAQLIKPLPHKHWAWSLRSHYAHKIQVGVVACMGGAHSRIPIASCIRKHQRDSASVNTVGNN